jgi:hypothetical protein
MSYQEYKRQRQQKIHVFKDELRKSANPSAKTVFRDMVIYSLLAASFQHFTGTCYPHFQAQKKKSNMYKTKKIQGVFKKINVMFTIPSVSILRNGALTRHDETIVGLSLYQGSI